MNWNTMAMIAMTVLYAADLQAKPMNLDCEFHLQAGVVYIHCCLLLLLLLGQQKYRLINRLIAKEIV